MNSFLELFSKKKAMSYAILYSGESQMFNASAITLHLKVCKL